MNTGYPEKQDSQAQEKNVKTHAAKNQRNLAPCARCDSS